MVDNPVPEPGHPTPLRGFLAGARDPIVLDAVAGLSDSDRHELLAALARVAAPARPPEPESLRAQLVQVNERSRVYTVQLWALPLGYLAVSAGVLVKLADGSKPQLAVALLGCGVLGVLLACHALNMNDGAWRAVEAINEVERLLGLPTTARKRAHFVPLLVAVLLAAAAEIVGAILVILR
jgi:hypothetical protein